MSDNETTNTEAAINFPIKLEGQAYDRVQAALAAHNEKVEQAQKEIDAVGHRLSAEIDASDAEVKEAVRAAAGVPEGVNFTLDLDYEKLGLYFVCQKKAQKAPNMSGLLEALKSAA